MVLSDADAQSLLTNPKNQVPRLEALRWQDRVRFHGLTVRDKSASAYWPVFRKWVFSFLQVTDKQEFFDKMFPFPVPTTRLLGEVHDSWMKVFDAVNPVLSINAADGVEDDLLAYLSDSKEADFWPGEAVSALLESPNDILLIDIREGVNGRPAPYLVRVPLDSVISIEINTDATLTHLAYLAGDGSKVVVDDSTYRVYAKPDLPGQTQNQGDVLTGTFTHNLGVCPARLLWDERVPNHAVATASPIDEVLSELDSYNFWYVAYEIFKAFGAFPIMYGAEQQAADPQPSRQHVLNQDGTVDAGFNDACQNPPAPGSNSFVGPGEFWEVPALTMADGKALQAPVGMVEPSTTTLEFHAQDRERLYGKLIKYLTGGRGESVTDKEAINKEQVANSVAGQENSLRYIAGPLSRCREWSIFTMGRLRYGNRVRSVSHSFGTDYYLETETDLWNGLTAAKTAGSPQTILYAKIQRIQSMRLRSGGNASREQIMLDLEPFPEQSASDLMGLAISGAVDATDLAVKVQFTNLIRLLERDLGADITQIGIGLPYNQRIANISRFMYSKVKLTVPKPALVPTEADTNNATTSNQ